MEIGIEIRVCKVSLAQKYLHEFSTEFIYIFVIKNKTLEYYWNFIFNFRIKKPHDYNDFVKGVRGSLYINNFRSIDYKYLMLKKN